MTSKPNANSGHANIDSSLKVAVLAGGIGSEREVSLQSGECVAAALEKTEINVVLADITPDNTEILDDSEIDVFFIALHGPFGEDGQLQQILEDRSLVYTGSGPAASKLTFDKIASKKIFTKFDIETPAAFEFDTDTNIEKLKKDMAVLGDKFVVKPIRQGSSVGIQITEGIDASIEVAENCLKEFDDCMIEQFVCGREVTVSILNSRALPIIEIKPQSTFYDYNAKYIDDKTIFLFDSITDKKLVEKINATAIDCYQSLNCRHFGRIDFILDDQNIPWVLEANTIPGLTSHSLLPKAAAHAGVSMTDACVEIIDAALETKTLKTIN